MSDLLPLIQVNVSAFDTQVVNTFKYLIIHLCFNSSGYMTIIIKFFFQFSIKIDPDKEIS